MPSDAKVPDPLPRGLTVPAVAVVVLVLTGAIWGIGLFLLGRQTAPVVEVADAQCVAHLAALNRIDQAIVRGDPADIIEQLRGVTLPEGPIGQTALELRRARLTALAVERKASEAAGAAKRAAASPEAVLTRLQANLWQLYPQDLQRIGETSHQPIVAIDVPLVETTSTEAATSPRKPAPPAPVLVKEPPSSPALAELTLGGERFVPDARIAHPTITARAYALHPTKGLLRSDDAGTTWRVGLAPLQQLKGWRLHFTSGDRPLLNIGGGAGKVWAQWLFADNEDAFFP